MLVTSEDGDEEKQRGNGKKRETDNASNAPSASTCHPLDTTGKRCKDNLARNDPVISAVLLVLPGIQDDDVVGRPHDLQFMCYHHHRPSRSTVAHNTPDSFRDHIMVHQVQCALAPLEEKYV